MTGRKRLRTPLDEEEDVSDKKQRGNGNFSAPPRSNGNNAAMDMRPQSTVGVVGGRGLSPTVVLPSPSPSHTKNHVKQSTPYQSKLNGNKPSSVAITKPSANPDSAGTTILHPSLESVGKPAVAPVPAPAVDAPTESKAIEKRKKKATRRGPLYYCTVLFLLFLWIGSSAVLGGLWAAEFINHQIDVWRLTEMVRDTPPTTAVVPVSVRRLEDEVDQLKLQVLAARQEAAGYRLEFEEILQDLEAQE